MYIRSLADLLDDTPSAALFEAALGWLDSHPDHADASAVQAHLAEWPSAHRVLHDANGWNLAIEPRPWSALVHGLVFFDWGPWPEAYAQLAASTHLTGLRRLEVHQGQLTDDGARALGASAWLPAIEHLVLTSVDLTPAGASALAQGLGKVRHLDVSINALTDVGLDALVTAVGASIEHLDAGQTNVCEIASLVDGLLPRLGTLILPANMLSIAAVDQIGRAAWLPRLEHLNLSFSLGSAEHLAALVGGDFERSTVTLEIDCPPNGPVETVCACLRSTHAGLRQIGVENLQQMAKPELKATAQVLGVKGSSRLSKAGWLAAILAATQPLDGSV